MLDTLPHAIVLDKRLVTSWGMLFSWLWNLRISATIICDLQMQRKLLEWWPSLVFKNLLLFTIHNLWIVKIAFDFIYLDVIFIKYIEFLYFWSWVFLITTTLVWILKTEKPEEIDFSDEPRLSLVDSYKLLWHIIRLKSVKRLILFLLTCKVGVHIF